MNNNASAISMTCQSVAKDEVDILKNWGLEDCGFRLTKVIDWVSADSLPCILLRLSTRP